MNKFMIIALLSFLIHGFLFCSDNQSTLNLENQGIEPYLDSCLGEGYRPVSADVGNLLSQSLRWGGAEELLEFVTEDLRVYYESDDYLRDTRWKREGGNCIYVIIMYNYHKSLEAHLNFLEEGIGSIYGEDARTIEKKLREELQRGLFVHTFYVLKSIAGMVDLRHLYHYLDKDELRGNEATEIKCENLRWFGERRDFFACLHEFLEKQPDNLTARKWAIEFMLEEPGLQKYVKELTPERERIGFNSFLQLRDLLFKHGSYSEDLLTEALEYPDYKIRRWAICYIGENRVRNLYRKLAEMYMEVAPDTIHLTSNEYRTREDFNVCNRVFPLKEIRGGYFWEAKKEKQQVYFEIREGF